MNNQVYQNYAAALYEIAEEKKLVVEYEETLQALQKVFDKNESYFRFLCHPSVALNAKYKIINQLKLPRNQKEIKNFLKILLSNSRFQGLDEIIEEFHHLHNIHHGVKEGTIYSAFSLTKTQITRIEEKLSEVEGSKIELRNKIQDELIGGIKVVIGDRVYSDNINERIENLRKSLLK